MAARSRPSSPSTTHSSISHDSSDESINIPDRMRLHRQMDLELNHPSYATSTGAHEEDDTVGSFDIETGAEAMSTRHRFLNMLPQGSPSVLDSKIINGHFADFTMNGVPLSQNYDDDSIEIGRNNSKQHSSRLQSTTPKGYAKSPLGNSHHLSNGSGAAARRNIRAASKQAQPAKSSQPVNQKPHVGSQSRQPFSTDADESTIGSIDRPQSALNTRFVGQPKPNSPNHRVPSIAQQKEATELLQQAAQDANIFAADGRRSAPAALSEEQGTVRRNIPSGFKTTQQFLGELGLPADTKGKGKEIPSKSQQQQQVRASMNANVSVSRTPVSKPHAPNSTVQSFRLPDMTGISELVSKYANENSTQIDIAVNPATHKPIESLPLPQDERAILMALNMLQEKVHALESQKAKDEQRNAELEEDLEQTRQLYNIEAQGRRAAEAELNQRKRSDSALGTDNDSEREGGWAGDREKLQTKKAIERIRLENNINSQRQLIETLQQNLELSRRSLRNITIERDDSVARLAATLTVQEDLRKENDMLKAEVARLRHLLQEHDAVNNEDRDIYEAKIVRYREKIRRLNETAKDATNMAREATRLLRASRAASGEGHEHASGAAPAASAPQKPRKRSISKKRHSDRREEVIEPKHTSQPGAPAQEVAKPSTKQSTKPAIKSNEKAPKPQGSKLRRKRIILQEVSETEDEGDETIQIAQDIADQSIPQHNETTFTEFDKENEEPASANVSMQLPINANETLVSMIDDNEVAQLRAQIEQERAMAEEAAAAASAQASKAAQKKSSKSAEQAQKAKEAAQKQQAAKGQKRVFIFSPEDGETSVSEGADSQGEESGSDVEEAPPAPQVSDHIQDVIDNLGVHDELRCTVCRRKAEVEFCQVNGHSGNIVHPADREDSIIPAEVVPVSKRMPEPQQDEQGWIEEPTMRPSVPPKAALEKVLQQLQDEFNHLRLDYNTAQAEFLALDPSLGKRRRKSLTVKMNGMVEELDRKADQIYALYDVAELTHNNSQQSEDANPFGKGKARAVVVEV